MTHMDLEADGGDTSRAAAAADVSTEELFQMDMLGISIDYLKEWYDTNNAATEGFAQMSTTDVCVKLVVPSTLANRSSFSALQMANNVVTTSGIPAFAKATHFVSHAWKYNFCEVVQALEIYCNGQADADQKTPIYLWFDLFVVDQHHAVSHPHSWWSSTFVNAIASIGKVILIFQPFLSPIPLTRAWCLWEIYAALSSDISVDITMPPDQWTDFRFALRENHESVIESVEQMDARQAEAFNPLDRDAIFATIAAGVGFDELNSRVRRKIYSILLSGAARESTRDHHITRLQRLLSVGADVNCVTGHLSPLGVACDLGDLVVVEFLISSGADVNCGKMVRGQTPLHLACRMGHCEVVALLLAAGADRDHRNAAGRTPAEEAEVEINRVVQMTSSSGHSAHNNSNRNSNNDDNATLHASVSSVAIATEEQKASAAAAATRAALEAKHAPACAAMCALHDLNKCDIAEARSMSRPPAPLLLSLRCMCLIRNIPKHEKDYYTVAKAKFLSKASFQEEMVSLLNSAINKEFATTAANEAEARACLSDVLFGSEAQLRCSKLGWAVSLWCIVMLDLLEEHRKQEGTETDQLVASSADEQALSAQTLSATGAVLATSAVLATTATTADAFEQARDASLQRANRCKMCINAIENFHLASKQQQQQQQAAAS